MNGYRIEGSWWVIHIEDEAAETPDVLTAIGAGDGGEFGCYGMAIADHRR
jgi:hypothetical protein